MELRRANPGDLGGPVINGLELRDAVGAEFDVADMDEGKRQVMVRFPHEQVDTYKTAFSPECFRDSFEWRKPTMVWQHRIDEPIGHALSAQVTKRANELVNQFSDFGAVPRAHQAFCQIRDGDITDFSFGFKGAKYERAESLGRGVRRITKALMIENSPVTIGSIPGAKATGLREDGEDDPMELGQILHMRDSGLITFDGFRALIEEHHPELLEKIVVTDPGTRDTGTANNSGGDPDDDGDGDDPEEPNANLEWTAHSAGFHTATGPNGETATVIGDPDADAEDEDPVAWFLETAEGEPIGNGREGSITDAKSTVESKLGKQRSDWDIEGQVIDADFVRAYIEATHPELGLILRGAVLAIQPLGEEDEAGSRAEPDELAADLVSSLDGCLRGAMEHLEGVDIATLPESVQETVALLDAAATTNEVLMEAMGVEVGTRSDSAPDGWDTGDWDGDEANYTPEQYKAAALIDTGEGDPDSKGRYALPVKTPEGKISVKGVAAAAGRLDQVNAPDEEKRKAAHSLMSLYGKLGKPVPANVLKVAGKGERSDKGEHITPVDPEELEKRREAALSRLSRRIPAA